MSRRKSRRPRKPISPAKNGAQKLADRLFLEYGKEAYHRAIDMWMVFDSVGNSAEAGKYKKAAEHLSHLGGAKK